MADRPTAAWRRYLDEQTAKLHAGTLDEHDAWAVRLFPDSLIVATDAALDGFEQALNQIDVRSDVAVLAEVERVVVALNGVNERHGGSGYETGEREELCDHIDAALTDAGVHVDALAARNGLKPSEITDRWRDW
ncbi:hypothetical protein [Micromonospora endophytica]|uniref:Uncharacterized protein n=1 Tax=Micromonospora endophytica TaxID=515350 RepID=A0A2W2D2R1_9ACTN|nr:hypothetical protein [Micromonospora endophytica]PZF94437.1 hypothetical protein C1I93_16545 [Micromonospora endophytica]RIW42653.1 hypothetical protein D3H59_22725 [Micromonospora endophytica]BCJ60724.1 hypothetical protein Jiend_41460 [Micromonospora endophytica]